MNELEEWLQALSLRDSSRLKLIENFKTRGLLQLNDLALHKTETEYWQDLFVLCELNMGEKSRCKVAVNELQLRLPNEIEQWLKASQLRKSVVDNLVNDLGFTSKKELLYYQSDKADLAYICKMSEMNMGEKARFLQAVQRLGEEPAPEVDSFSFFSLFRSIVADSIESLGFNDSFCFYRYLRFTRCLFLCQLCIRFRLLLRCVEDLGS
jgi:hypothetical protein